ncbi:olfactory receptor 50 [Sigmodon hispidus]
MYSALFLAMYLTTVLGNLLIILLIRLDSHLHTPMYFFLSHLAFTDISFSTVTAPKMLMNMLTHSQSISYAGCISQVYFFLLFGCIDNLLLTSMAYDSTNDKDVIVAVMYTVVTPMLNPFIYSLRNQQIKGALRNILARKMSSQ